MKKVISILVITFMAAMLFTGCGGQTQPGDNSSAPKQSSDASGADKKFKIGINNFGLANFFARIGKTTMEKTITEMGGEVVASVTADVNSRTAAIENMIQQGVDAIIIEEGDITQVAPAIKEAKKAGIIIASMDAGVADYVDVYVSSDNTLLGKAAAEQMVKLMGEKGNVLEIYNDAGSMIKERKEAMHQVVANYPDMEIAYGFVYAWPDFFPDVKAKTEALLQAHPKKGDIGGVFATFDGAGYAAAAAIREAGLQDSIVVVGIDGDPEAYKEMKLADSPFKATIAQDPETIAKTCVEKVFDLLNGKTLDNKVIKIPGVVITKDNIPDVE
jgi:ribose transport system substrate-binding protein